MSKLYFRYGAMNCGKSSALMQVAYNYEQNNKKVIVIKSEIDTKGNNYLESRIGLKRKVDILLKENESIEKYYNKLDIGILLKNYNLFWLSEDNVISITLT